MLSEFQNWFVDPEDHSSLVFEGESSEGRWWHGVLRSERGEMWHVDKGIPNFIREPIDGVNWKASYSYEACARNWDSANGVFELSSPLREVAEECVRRGRPVLDIASGPGGGWMPSILHLDATLPVMASDAGMVILDEWWQFIEDGGIAAPVCFAGFDARKMPIATNSVATLTSFHGVGNIHGRLAAIREAERVLEDDGVLYAVEGEFDKPPLVTLCERKGWDYAQRFGEDGMMSWRERFADCGFRVVTQTELSRKRSKSEDGYFPQVAGEVGVELWWATSLYRLTT